MGPGNGYLAYLDRESVDTNCPLHSPSCLSPCCQFFPVEAQDNISHNYIYIDKYTIYNDTSMAEVHVTVSTKKLMP